MAAIDRKEENYRNVLRGSLMCNSGYHCRPHRRRFLFTTIGCDCRRPLHARRGGRGSVVTSSQGILIPSQPHPPPTHTSSAYVTHMSPSPFIPPPYSLLPYSPTPIPNSAMRLRSHPPMVKIAHFHLAHMLQESKTVHVPPTLSSHVTHRFAAAHAPRFRRLALALGRAGRGGCVEHEGGAAALAQDALASEWASGSVPLAAEALL